MDTRQGRRGLLKWTTIRPPLRDPRSGGPGGIRGGQVYGASDKVAAYPADRPVAPEDIAKTLYHLMGVDDLQAIDREGQPFDLLPEGRALTELL